MGAHGPWRVVSLSPARRDDFLDFFDHERGRAFADNPAWAGCYCHFFHLSPAIPWASLDGAANRTAMAARIEVGEMEGFLALDAADRVVGWLNAQPRHRIPHCFARLGLAPPPIDVPVHEAAVIVCFVIDPATRRQGVARALLDHALADLAVRGVRIVDAFPAARARKPADHFRGPRKLFEAAGFARIATDAGKLAMRRRLT